MAGCGVFGKMAWELADPRGIVIEGLRHLETDAIEDLLTIESGGVLQWVNYVRLTAGLRAS